MTAKAKAAKAADGFDQLPLGPRRPVFSGETRGIHPSPSAKSTDHTTHSSGRGYSTKTARHGWVRSAKCELRQDLMAPPPGGTPPHAALISAAHSLMTPCCCAIVDVAESNTMAPIAKILLAVLLIVAPHRSQIR